MVESSPDHTGIGALEPALARRMSGINVSAIREILKVTERPDVISFAGGLPAPELFPVEEIAQAHAEVFAKRGQAALQYGPTEGFALLRGWLSRRLSRLGIETEPDRVIVTTGSQQGIDLVAKILIDPGDAVVVENPSYLAALQAFKAYEASVVAVEGDDSGMKIEQLEPILQERRPKLIYVVSDFHNPTGTSLSIQRRQQLVEIAARYRVPILEDDPYGELHYGSDRVPPVAAYDKTGLVIYISTFSKTLSPGMRIGWLAASPPVVRAAVIVKQAADLHTSSVEQTAVFTLLETFDYDGHLSDLRTTYAERLRAMLAALERHFPADTTWTRPEGGLFVWVELPKHIIAEELLVDALLENVAFVPGSPFFACRPRYNFIRLNFSNREPSVIDRGIQIIGELIKRRASQ